MRDFIHLVHEEHSYDLSDKIKIIDLGWTWRTITHYGMLIVIIVWYCG